MLHLNCDKEALLLYFTAKKTRIDRNNRFAVACGTVAAKDAIRCSFGARTVIRTISEGVVEAQ